MWQKRTFLAVLAGLLFCAGCVSSEPDLRTSADSPADSLPTTSESATPATELESTEPKDGNWVGSESFSFSIVDELEDGLIMTTRGDAHEDEGLLFTFISEDSWSDQYELARVVDGQTAIASEGWRDEWNHLVWQVADEYTASFYSADLLVVLLEPVYDGLSAQPVESEVEILDSGGLVVSWRIDGWPDWDESVNTKVEYWIGDDGLVNRVRLPELETEYSIDISGHGQTAPQPDVTTPLHELTVEYANFNPIVLEWLQHVPTEDQSPTVIVPLDATTTSTTLPRALWIEPADAVGGAILLSYNAEGIGFGAEGSIGENYGQGPIEELSNCERLDLFNTRQDSTGYIRIQSYSAHLESQGAFHLQSADYVFEEAQLIAESCPTIDFEDGTSAVVTPLALELVPGWHGFVLDYDGMDRQVWYGFGLRESLLSVVRIEHNGLPSETNYDEQLVSYVETSNRRLQEAPAS